MTSEERKLPISNIMFEILDFLNSPQEKTIESLTWQRLGIP